MKQFQIHELRAQVEHLHRAVNKAKAQRAYLPIDPILSATRKTFDSYQYLAQWAREMIRPHANLTVWLAHALGHTEYRRVRGGTWAVGDARMRQVVVDQLQWMLDQTQRALDERIKQRRNLPVNVTSAELIQELKDTASAETQSIADRMSAAVNKAVRDFVEAETQSARMPPGCWSGHTRVLIDEKRNSFTVVMWRDRGNAVLAH